MKTNLYLGKNPLYASAVPVAGQQVTLEGEAFYQIANYDRLRPFFMSIVSGGDHWMFISSTGALTAGRRNPDLALFPYYTDDKIHDSAEITGSKTVLIVRQQGRDQLWEPFSNRYPGVHRIRRNLYKNFVGNKLVFEEINDDLGLTFRYGWFNSERFGFVRKAWLANSGPAPASVTLLDGIQNLMPCGVGSQFQLDKSTLLDAYKRNELLSETGLGLFRLSSIPIDRPEPAEALKTTTVFSIGPAPSLKLLSSVQLDHFRRGQPVREETDVRAERGAYFVQTKLTLRPGQTANWLLVADVARGPSEVAELQQLLRRPTQLRREIESDIALGTVELERIVASADGLQKSARPLGDARHFGNVLFNVMRGGIFNDGYQVEAADVQVFIRHANRDVATRHAKFFRQLGHSLSPAEGEKVGVRGKRPPAAALSDSPSPYPLPFRRGEGGALRSRAVCSAGCLINLAAATNDPQLERLCHEYLPLTFSRRHGDPSRPWNRFSIATRNPNGTRLLGYEGNWRDIFQNWEALAVSFPGYVASMIAKFVNASTADGYNPYRITRAGIDWEVVDPHDPWSYIGYWGDHQIIYLLKLLEILERHEPATLREFLTREIFCYANVPYRIQPYAELLQNPKDTVVFDHATEETVARRVCATGLDGKLVCDPGGNVRLVNLTEKLLVSLLAKLSNFIPEAGIWLNTQRPEWNDANNALVGNGASMVTVYYLRRMLTFCCELLGSTTETDFSVSEEVATHLAAVNRTLTRHCALLGKRLSDQDRKRLTDELGQAASRYRAQIYAKGFSGQRRKIKRTFLLSFLAAARDATDASIRANRRADGLYHAYNLIRLDQPGAITIRRLYEMLEGQVAVLSSGLLSAEESLEVLTALKRSAMYRADQHSYLLYPNRELPRFVERNNIPAKQLNRSALLRKLVTDGNRQLVEPDVAGQVHFNGAVTNARDLRRILDQLAASGYAQLVKRDAPLVLDLFEQLFDHESFTGRSGTFFGYEGLGSIYWHMVSKLLLAVQETFFHAANTGAAKAVLPQLAACYYDIRAGLGDSKSPEEYGAFPMDPYSHTPGHAGARQPGLTGQVKEDILCRLGELGVLVSGGRIHFRPLLLRPEEFIPSPTDFEFFDVAGHPRKLRLKANSLAFTYCQLPIVYQLAAKNSLKVFRQNSPPLQCEELRLDADTSGSVFNRDGTVTRIEVTLERDSLPAPRPSSTGCGVPDPFLQPNQRIVLGRDSGRAARLSSRSVTSSKEAAVT